MGPYNNHGVRELLLRGEKMCSKLRIIVCHTCHVSLFLIVFIVDEGIIFPGNFETNLPVVFAS